MENLPQNPYILLSYINTKLRDDFESLDELCAALDVDKNALIAKLADEGFVYSSETNRFS